MELVRARIRRNREWRHVPIRPSGVRFALLGHLIGYSV